MNYLIIYGGGTRAIRKWFGMTQNDARATLQRMHRAYPEVGALQGRIEHALEDRGYVKSPLTGRHWRLQGSGYQAVQKEGYRFINYLIQGTAADIIKAATARCHEAGIDLVAIIHDEILAEVDADKAEEAARIIEDAMTEGFEGITSKIPITAEAKIVDRWSQAKDPDYVPEYIKESE
jgi:DNA polymerase I-like protein with 3'-5' exonuclease and polymerase domains